MLKSLLKLLSSEPKETTVWINQVSESQVNKFRKGEQVFFKDYTRVYKNGKRKKEIHVHLKSDPDGLKVAKLRDTENWWVSTLNKHQVKDIFFNTDGWQMTIR